MSINPIITLKSITMNMNQQKVVAEELKAIKLKILSMIEECTDKESKIHLLIQLEFISSLSINTSAVLQLSSNFEEHIEHFEKHVATFNTHVQTNEAMVQRLTGAKPLVVWIGRAIYGVCIAFMVFTYNTLIDINASIAVSKSELAAMSKVIDKHLAADERYK